MKQLHILEPGEIELGPVSAATEGFVDTLMSFFIKNPQREQAKLMEAKKQSDPKEISDRLEQDLKATYDNPQWVEKRLAGKTGLIRVAALQHANVDGAQVTSPSKLVEIAREMARVGEDIARREKPFTTLRQNIVDQISKSNDPNKTADALWEKYEKQLTPIAAARYLSASKRNYPCLGHNAKIDGEWPVPFKGNGREGFNTYFYEKTDGHFEAPNPDNAEEFATAIRDMMKLAQQTNELYQQNKLVYWEDGDCDYNQLTHFDEVYERIYYSQHIDEINSLLYGLKRTFGEMVIGLYIAMYDPHDKSVV